jgi:DNA transformation protein and related proteins
MLSRETLIEDVPHMGPASSRWLGDAGIATWGDLVDAGALGAYERVRAIQPKASLNLLYGLAGVLRGVAWTQVDARERAELKAQARDLSGGR